MSKEKLIKRLRWYYPLEKFHAFFLITFYFVLNHPFLKNLAHLWYVGLHFYSFSRAKILAIKAMAIARKIVFHSKEFKVFKKLKHINLLF